MGKVLTIRQPWAQLVVQGDKKIETRGWITKYRGWVLIHAAKSFHFMDLHMCEQDKHFKTCIPDYTKLQTSAIIGQAFLYDVVPQENILATLTEQERKFGIYGPDRYAWLLSHAEVFAKPYLNVMGQQGLWNYELIDHPQAVTV